MKKSLALTLALVFVLGIAGTAFAANPFVDVPANHWAYAAVKNLAKAGLVDGMSDGTFKGDKEMTRYEMAQIVAKAMAKTDKADAANKALIEKLQAEFAAELDNLGVRVSNLEKKVGNVKITGDYRARYRANTDLTDTENTAGSVASKFDQRVRVNFNAAVADNVDFWGRLAYTWTNDAQEGATTTATTAEVAKATIKNVMPSSNLEVGRSPLFLGQGLLADTVGGFDSVKLTFGNKLNGFVAYGDISSKSTGLYKNFPVYNNDKSFNIAVANLAYNFSDKFGMTAAYIQPLTKVGNASQTDANVYAIGAKAVLSPEFTLTGEYAKNTKWEDNNKAYFARLAYKGAKADVVNSWGMFVDYVDVQPGAVDNGLTTLIATNAPFNAAGLEGISAGEKGVELGIGYTLAKNTILNAQYAKVKTNVEDFNNVDYKNWYKVELNFMF